MPWHSTGIADSALAAGELRPVEVASQELVLVRIGGDVFALSDHCPHRDGQLSEGTLEGDRLTCPLHGATFDVPSGAVRADPFGIEPPDGGVEPVPSFAVKVEAGTLWVELP